jgi:hypothetical protein
MSTNRTNRVRGKRNWKQTNFLAKSQRLPTRRARGRERGYANRGVEKTRKLNLRGFARRHDQISHEPRSYKANPRLQAASTKASEKRALLIAAWEVGFRGKSYRKAKRFERALERRRK